MAGLGRRGPGWTISTAAIVTLAALAMGAPGAVASGPTCHGPEEAVCTGDNTEGGDPYAVCRGPYVDAFVWLSPTVWHYHQVCVAEGPAVTVFAAGAAGHHNETVAAPSPPAPA